MLWSFLSGTAVVLWLVLSGTAVVLWSVLSGTNGYSVVVSLVLDSCSAVVSPV